jgi:hypothetical protein
MGKQEQPSPTSKINPILNTVCLIEFALLTRAHFLISFGPLAIAAMKCACLLPGYIKVNIFYRKLLPAPSLEKASKALRDSTSLPRLKSVRASPPAYFSDGIPDISRMHARCIIR